MAGGYGRTSRFAVFWYVCAPAETPVPVPPGTVGMRRTAGVVGGTIAEEPRPIARTESVRFLSWQAKPWAPLPARDWLVTGKSVSVHDALGGVRHDGGCRTGIRAIVRSYRKVPHYACPSQAA